MHMTLLVDGVVVAGAAITIDRVNQAADHFVQISGVALRARNANDA